MKRPTWVLLTIALSSGSMGIAHAQVTAPMGSPGFKDPMELCGKLAGTERDICARQARETPATGATPGGLPGTLEAKPEKDKRGNTPPGTSRGGDAPAAGAIVDPAGVTKR